MKNSRARDFGARAINLFLKTKRAIRSEGCGGRAECKHHSLSDRTASDAGTVLAN
jgi:hypothetical protein